MAGPEPVKTKPVGAPPPPEAAKKPEGAKPEPVKPEAAKPEAAKPEAAKPEAAKPADQFTTGWNMAFFADFNPYIPYLSGTTASFGNDRYDDHTSNKLLDITLRVPQLTLFRKEGHKLYTGPQLRLAYQTVSTEIPAEFGPNDKSYADLTTFTGGWNLGGVHGSENDGFEWRLAAELGFTHVGSTGKNAAEDGSSGYEGLRWRNITYPSDIDETGLNIGASAYVGYRHTFDNGLVLGGGVKGFLDKTFIESALPNYDTNRPEDEGLGLGIPRMGALALFTVGYDGDKPKHIAITPETPARPEPAKPEPAKPEAPKPVVVPPGTKAEVKAVADKAGEINQEVATSLGKKHGEAIKALAAGIDPKANKEDKKAESYDRAKDIVAEYKASKAEYEAVAAKLAAAEKAMGEDPIKSMTAEEKKPAVEALATAKAEVEKLKADMEANQKAALEAVQSFYKISNLGAARNKWATDTIAELGGKKK